MAEYFAPDTMEDVLNTLGKKPVTIIAGGTDVYPAQGDQPFHQDLLDITRVPFLRGIQHTADGWRFGATTSWTDIVKADLPAAFDGLKAAAREVGSLQIQNAGTIAGNLCNASPAADGVPPLLTLDAQVELVSAKGTRVLPLTEFLTGARQTALAPSEVLSAVLIPNQPDNVRATFGKLGARTYLVISIAMVAALIACDDKGQISLARIAVGSCAPVAQRLTGLEKAIVGRRPNDVQVTRAHLSPLHPIDDVRGTASYRLDAVAELCQRLIREVGDSHE